MLKVYDKDLMTFFFENSIESRYEIKCKTIKKKGHQNINVLQMTLKK